MKYSDVLDRHEKLSSIEDIKGVKVNYAISRNISILKPVIDSLMICLKSSDRYKEYEKKRLKIAEKHAQKDKVGKPVIEDNIFIGLIGNEEFTKEFEALKEEYKDALIEKEKQIDEYNSMLDEDIKEEIIPHLIKIEDIPEDITTKQMNALCPFITD